MSNQYVAKTVITRTVTPGQKANPVTGEPAKRPVTRDIQPGTIFVPKGEELADLLRVGAIEAYVPQSPSGPEALARAQEFPAPNAPVDGDEGEGEGEGEGDEGDEGDDPIGDAKPARKRTSKRK